MALQKTTAVPQGTYPQFGGTEDQPTAQTVGHTPHQPPVEEPPFVAEEAAERPHQPAQASVPQAAVQAQPPATAAHVPVFDPKALEALGFKDLVIDFTSFPIIRLKDGLFEDTRGRPYGKEFFCRLLSQRSLWVVRGLPPHPKQPDNKTDIAYTYDKVTTTKDAVVDYQIAQWEAEGKTIDWKEYREVLVLIVGGAYDGDFCLLTISPQSKGRITPHLLSTQFKYGSPANTVTRVYVGNKVTNAVHPFYPWEFADAGAQFAGQ